MPYVSLPIEEIDESVKRPIVASVITELMHLFGLPDELPIVFKGQAPQAPYLKSTVKYHYLDQNNRYNAETYLTITEAEYEDNETTLLNDNVFGDQPPIFAERKLGLFLYPVYNSKKVTVSANITGTLTQVERWRAAIKRRTQHGMLNETHTVKFHYPIPMQFMALLFDAFELREKVAGYGDALGDWIAEHFRPTMTVLRSANGGSPVFAIAETQTPIQGWFDFGTGAPKPVKDDEISRYSLSFTYTFYCDVPEAMNARYEYIVHNQLMNKRWIIQPPKLSQIDFIKKEGAYSQQALNKFRYNASANEYVYSTRPGLPIPTFDDWIGDKPAEGYVTCVRAMTRVSDDVHRVMNYGNLGAWTIHRLCHSYMMNLRELGLLWYDNVMVSMLYRDYELMDMSKLNLNGNFVLYTEEELNLRGRYHTVLAMLNDAGRLTTLGRQLMKHNGCFFKYWMNTIYPGIAEKYGWDIDNCELGSADDELTDNDIDDIIDDATGNNGGKAIWGVVGHYTLISKRAN